MLERYKKTLVPMQAFILLVTLAMLLWSHRLAVGTAFFLVMQIGAVLGAVWASRLKLKIERANVR